MDFAVSPEPPEHHRRALAAAIAELVDAKRKGTSAWWREGVRGNVADEAPAQSASSYVWSTSQGANPWRR